MRLIPVSARLSVQTMRVTCLVALTLLPQVAFAQTGISAEAASSTGIHAERSYFSPLPYEHFDPSNGNVVLSFVDLELPGNAGRPLRFTRTYNTQSAPGGEPVGYQPGYWTFGIEGLVTRIIERPTLTQNLNCGPGASCYYRNLPSFVFADGGERQTIWDGVPSLPSVPSQYRVVSTSGFIYYDRSTGTMKYPNGVIAHYDSILHPDGTRTGTGRLLDFADAYGNTVTLTYVGSELTVTQSLGTNPARVVTFALNAEGQPESMSYADATGTRVWQYGYSESAVGRAPDYPLPRTQHVLETVTLPGGGPGWQFGYASQQQWFITPQGGRVDYAFNVDSIPLPEGGSVPLSWLSSRTSGADSWTLSTPSGGNGVTKMVVDVSDGSRVTYEFKDFFPSFTQPYLNSYRLWKTTIEQSVGAPLETTVFDYQLVRTVFSVQSQYWNTPEVSTRTITRDGRTYTTTYAYSLSSDTGDYHHPSTVTETSAGQTRTTSTAWREPDAARFVVGLPLEQHVQAGTEHWQRHWFYSDIGFLEKTWDWFRMPEAAGHETTYAPDAYGNVASVTKGNNKTTTFNYEWGVVKDSTTPEYTVSREINPDGTVASETQAGRTSTFQYDPLERYLTQTQPPGGPSQSNPVVVTVDPDRQWVRTSRGASQLTTTLDGFGRPIATADSVGVQTNTTYDLHGRITRTSAPFALPDSPQETVVAYDALGRVLQQTSTDNSIRTYVYGPGTVTIQENGHETVQTWSGFGSPADARLTTVEDAKHDTWAYAYDALGALVSVSGPGGVARTWSYNGRHELVSETHPESGTVSYGPYDAAGVLLQKTDANGQVFTYAYDNNDRLRTITAGSDVTEITYEPGSDNRATMTNATVASTLLWDAQGRSAGRTDAIDGITFNTRYEYDLNDQVKSIFYPALGSATNRRRIGYQFDSENRISRVYDLQATRDYAYDFHYHPVGGLQEFRSGNGVRNLLTFDPQRFWLTSSSVSDLSGGGIWTLQYQNYDAAGNVGTIVDSRAGLTQSFAYDEIDRLIAATGPYGSIAYAYDPHGNRMDANGSTYTYEPGTLRLQTQNGESFTYDNNGNLKTGTAKSFAYTPRNMLATATVNGTSAAYAYDADDWRVKKTSGATTTYYFRGPNGELLTEWKNPGPSGETKDYVYAGSRLIATIGRPEDDSPNDIYGTIEADGPPVVVDFTTPTQFARLTFEAMAGQRVSVLAAPATNCVWPVAILDPQGQTVAYKNGCGPSVLEPVVLASGGTHTVLVDHNGWLGPVTVNLYNVTDVTGQIIPDGPSVTAPLLKPGQNARLTFEGVPGRRVSAVALFPSVCLAWPLAILRPDGSTLASSIGCGSTIVDPVTIDVPGTYTVLLDPNGAVVGTAVISLYDVEDINDSIQFDSTITVPLVDPGQKATFTFSGSAGQTVSVRALESPSTSSCLFWPLAIIKPDGVALSSGVSCGDKFIDRVMLPVSGTYQLVIDPHAYSVGTALVTLFDVPDVTGSITAGGAGATVGLKPGQRATLTFAGTAGQPVSAVASWSTGYGLAYPLAILKPDGTTLATQSSTSSPVMAGPVVLPTTGTYTLLLDPLNEYSGTPTLTLYNVEDLIGSLVINNAAISVPVVPGQIATFTFAGTAAQSVTVRITSNTMSTTLVTLRHPNGTTLTSKQSSASSFNLTTQTLPVSGTYTVVIDPYQANSGSLLLRVTSP